MHNVITQILKNAKDAKEALASVVRQYFDTMSTGNADLLNNVMSASYNPTPKGAFLPYTYYCPEQKLFFCDDSSFGFGLVSCPIVGSDLNTHKQISLLIEQIPPKGALQVLLLASDDLDEVMHLWKEARVSKQDIYRKLEQYKYEYYSDYNARTSNNFKHRNYQLFFLFSMPTGGSKAQAKEFRDHLKSILSALNISASDLVPESFLSLLSEIINYPVDKNAKCHQYNKHDLLSHQISDLSNNMIVEENGISTNGGNFVSRLYQVDTYPEKFSLSEMTNLLGDSYIDNMQIPARFLISYTIINNISSSLQEGLKNKGALVIKQARSMLAAFNSSLKEEAYEWQQIEEQLKKQEKFMTSVFLVMITSKKELINKTEQSLVSLWRKNDMHLKSVKYFQLPSLVSICPFLISSGLLAILKKFNLSRTVLSSEGRALMPIGGEWRGSKNGGMLLSGKKGQLFCWDSFASSSNYNVCVIGESGSGKSMFLQEFVMSHLAMGAKVFVIDIGRSFEHTAKLLGNDADFYDFSSSSKFCLNPFSGLPEEEHESNHNIENGYTTNQYTASIVSDSLNLLKFTISKMVAPKEGTQDVQDAIISSSIIECWNKHKSASSIDHLSDILSSKGVRGKDLALMLFEYTSKGSYGKVFNPKPNSNQNTINSTTDSSSLTFAKDLTVLEFESLRERPDLGSVIMQMLAINIVQQVYLGSRKRKFIMIFDEAWYALSNFPTLLASMARTLRKYNGALVLGTQSITDFYSSKESNDNEDKARASIIENSGTRVFLKQKADSADRASKLGLSEGHINLIKNLEVVPNHYSESLIFGSTTNYFVAKLMLDKFSRTLYSSHPDTFSQINALIAKGVTISQAVEQYIDQSK